MYILALFFIFRAILCCLDSSEISSGAYIGFINNDVKTASRKQLALRILGWYKDWMGQFNTRQSFKAQDGELSAFIWVGSMIQNSGFRDNVINDFINEINTSGMPTEIYYEFIHNNALQSFGIILTTKGLDRAQTAVKYWSTGSSFNGATNSKSSNRLSICYLDYGKRKPEVNDNEAGQCFYNRLVSNPTGNAGEYLSVYNPSLDFRYLQVDQPYCYSEGYLPNFKPIKQNDGKCFSYKVRRGDTCSKIASSYYPLSVSDIENYNKNVYGWNGCDKLMYDTNICLSEGVSSNCNYISSNLNYGFIANEPKIGANKDKAIAALNYFKNEIHNSPDKRVIFYKNDNIVAYVWIGQKIDNLDNPIDTYINEVRTYGIPELSYYQYVINDPTKSFGITINVKGDSNEIKEIVKTWSSGQIYSKHDSKYINSNFCILTNSNKNFIIDNSVGNCFTFVYNDNLPLDYSVITDYNPSSSIDKGSTLCKSIGSKPSQEYCTLYIVKDNDSCNSIAKNFPPLTIQNIEDYNKNNKYFYGCNNIMEGDSICITKPNT